MKTPDYDNEDARDGGGAPSQRRPDKHDRERTEAPPTLPVETPVVNRRDIPGGSFMPAHTPGATGPTTRDTDI